MTDIKLYNTKMRRKEAFAPIREGDVRMYVCGPTVYDRAHLGNARPVVVFDILFRLLRHKYGEDQVTYVRNFTDVDDKINAKAVELQAQGDHRNLVEIIKQVTDETIEWYHADMKALGALRPNKEPRATEYIPEMVSMIENLIEKGHAYATEGHVLFDVNSYDAYGALSGRKLEDMRAGERVEIADYKHDPMDFVLWKPSTGDQPGWESPWGYGRPGWHIECSAMALDLLGESFDIHGGGLDLQFPHHENEIAQSCCANPSGNFAKVWMHNEMLQVEGKKMSKSLGNFFTVHDCLTGSAMLIGGKMEGTEIRMALLLSHYRNTTDFGVKRRHEAKTKIRKWAELLGEASSGDLAKLAPGKPFQEVVDCLSDDLDTPSAIKFLEPKKLKKTLGVNWREKSREILASQLLLGIDLRKNSHALSYSDQLDSRRENFVEAMQSYDELLEFAKRIDAARAIKDYETADRISSSLRDAGFEIRSNNNGTKITRNSDADFSKLEALK